MLLSEIPDELWCEDQARNRTPPKRGRLDEIRLYLEAGLSPQEIEQKTGLHRSSLQKYLQQINREGKTDEKAK
jgi:transposase